MLTEYAKPGAVRAEGRPSPLGSVLSIRGLLVDCAEATSEQRMVQREFVADSPCEQTAHCGIVRLVIRDGVHLVEPLRRREVDDEHDGNRKAGARNEET